MVCPLLTIVSGRFLQRSSSGGWRALIGPLRVRRQPYDPPFRFRQDGAFGVVRHPLYLGALVAAGAPVLVVPRAYLAGSWAFCFLALAVRAGQEEARLRAQLGQPYEEYCRGVKRLVPFLW